MANIISRTPVREQDPTQRAANFEEVCYGFNLEEAQREASRCLHCRTPRCVKACPVGIQIPHFIAAIAEGDLSMAANIIAEVIECDVVSCVGSRFVLYKESEKKKRIELPK